MERRLSETKADTNSDRDVHIDPSRPEDVPPLPGDDLRISASALFAFILAHITRDTEIEPATGLAGPLSPGRGTELKWLRIRAIVMHVDEPGIDLLALRIGGRHRLFKRLRTASIKLLMVAWEGPSGGAASILRLTTARFWSREGDFPH